MGRLHTQETGENKQNVLAWSPDHAKLVAFRSQRNWQSIWRPTVKPTRSVWRPARTEAAHWGHQRERRL